MDLQLTGKRAIITGGSKGIGLATAHALAAEGVDVVLAARTADTLKDAAEEVARRSGRRAIPVVTDTGDDESVRALVARAVDELGGVDILVNNASNQAIGAGFPDLAGTTDDAFWGDVNVKVVGYLRTARAVAPLLTEQGWGRIINVSGLGYRQTHSIVRSIRNVSVAALTKNLADELGPQGVNVTVVHPGVTRTETTTLKYREAAETAGRDVADYEVELANNAINRVVEAEEVADVITFLASPRSVSISGDAVAVGGGLLGTVNY
ncbi:SDR family NAD(P)-dependent oxidoreductase [Gordonia rubripertincta]|uniref:SDR family NAD(P)-dependent oxidoreductase n=1 Tax=Gordonia rubripertincta TaxID=36822 RepID=UPI000B8D513A|nr:SDR family NAD(P)-dependent oxidoreductase [Gordonia rubripertincta]ASR01713.1 3-oxoacyl-[acyl-carrier-protein] reductase FabG [Gordonia rubripertincta]